MNVSSMDIEFSSLANELSPTIKDVARELIPKSCSTVTSTENQKLVEGDAGEVSDDHKSSKLATITGCGQALVGESPEKLHPDRGSSNDKLLQNHSKLIDEIHSARIKRLLEVQLLEFTEFCVQRDAEKKEREKEHELNLGLIQVLHVDPTARKKKMRLANQEFSSKMDAFNQHMKCQRRKLTIMQLDAAEKERKTKDHFLQEIRECGLAESFDKVPLPSSGFKLERFKSFQQDVTHDGSGNSMIVSGHNIHSAIALGSVSGKSSDIISATVPQGRAEDTLMDTQAPVISLNGMAQDMSVETNPAILPDSGSEDVLFETECSSTAIHKLNAVESAEPSVPSSQVSAIFPDVAVEVVPIENRTRGSQYKVGNLEGKLDEVKVTSEGATVPNGGAEVSMEVETAPPQLNSISLDKSSEPSVPSLDHSSFSPQQVVDDVPIKNGATVLHSNIENLGGNMSDDMHSYAERAARAGIEHHNYADCDVEITPRSVESCDSSGITNGISSAIPNEKAEGLPVASGIPTTVPNGGVENVPMETETAGTISHARLEDISLDTETSTSQRSSIIPVKSAEPSGPSPKSSAISQQIAVGMSVEDETTVSSIDVRNSGCNGPDKMAIELQRIGNAIGLHHGANSNGACLTSSILQTQTGLPSSAHSLTNSEHENPGSSNEISTLHEQERSTASVEQAAGQSSAVRQIVVPALPSSVELANHDCYVQEPSQLQCHLSTNVEFYELGQGTTDAHIIRSEQCNYNQLQSSAQQTTQPMQQGIMPTDLGVEQPDQMVSQYPVHPRPAWVNITPERSYLQYFTGTRVLPESDQTIQHIAAVPNSIPAQELTNPFQDELTRIRKEEEIHTKKFDIKKEQLRFAYEKEIESIKKKYAERARAVEVEYIQNKRMLEMIGNKLNKQKDLAERFKTNFFKNKEDSPAALQGASRSSIQQAAWMPQHQLPQLASVSQHSTPSSTTTLPAALTLSLSPFTIGLRTATSAVASTSRHLANTEASAALSSIPVQPSSDTLLRAHSNFLENAQVLNAYDLGSQRHTSRFASHRQGLLNSQYSQSVAAFIETQPTGGSNSTTFPST